MICTRNRVAVKDVDPTFLVECDHKANNEKQQL